MAWTHLKDHAGILAVHAAYMGFGKILYFSGDQHDPGNNQHHQVDATRLFDCTTFAVTDPGSPGYDTFCCGHAFLVAANQVKLLAAGGTDHFPDKDPIHLHQDHFPGLRDAAIFVSPSLIAPFGSFGWSKAAEMNLGPLKAATKTEPKPDPNKTGGRWYPTLMTLATGDVIAMSGHPGESDAAHANNVPEIFSIKAGAKGAWRRLAPYTTKDAPGEYDSNAFPAYPRIHLLPTGDILCTNPVREGTWTFKPDTGANGGTYRRVCTFAGGAFDAREYRDFYKSSVLLPLMHDEGWHPRAMICGSRQAWILDLFGWRDATTGVKSWDWRATAKRAPDRIRRNAPATILPTGEIFVCGGIDVDQDEFDQLIGRRAPGQPDNRGVLDPEIYDPFAHTWTWLNDPAPIARNYHTVALLMPDGRVWVAGSDHDGNPGMDARVLDIDIYAPWYHGNPRRPSVTAAPSLAYPGETIVVKTTNADEMLRVVLLRCGSSTHAFNPDQRYLSLSFRHVVDDILLVQMPPNNNIVPPGPYMIFTVRKDANPLGLPSNGTTVYVVPEHDPKHDG
ncbi:UNVERIFIED_ORG: hypothetical protein J2W82_001352 [Pseudomonas mohnii]|nr:hypothetical protein [Pseudomonas mohnii]